MEIFWNGVNSALLMSDFGLWVIFQQNILIFDLILFMIMHAIFGRQTRWVHIAISDVASKWRSCLLRGFNSFYCCRLSIPIKLRNVCLRYDKGRMSRWWISESSTPFPSHFSASYVWAMHGSLWRFHSISDVYEFSRSVLLLMMMMMVMLIIVHNYNNSTLNKGHLVDRDAQ